MQQGRVSTIRFNEWICVCAQYEKAVARLGRQVYQGYSRGLVDDYASSELCKEISQAFADSKQVRADMEEEVERDALHGLSAEESKMAEEALELSEGARLIRMVKLKVARLMGRQAVNRSLQSYRDRVRDLSRDLGLRALALHNKEPILKLESHKRLCQLALKLDEDSNRKWDEIVKGKSEKGGLDMSFHTLLISFVGSFANFSRNTSLGKMVLKFVKYDPKEEEKKLTKQYEGTKTADALEAQMSETDEPDLDIGREMASMEREYLDTPTDWGLPPLLEADNWVPDTSDSWSPDAAVEVVPAPVVPQPVAEAPKPQLDVPKPQVLRQRSQPETFGGAGAWVANSADKAPDPEPWTPPAASGPRIGQNPAKAVAAEEDWASEGEDEEDAFAAPQANAPRLGGVTSAPIPQARPATPPEAAYEEKPAPFQAPTPPPPPTTQARPTPPAAAPFALPASAPPPAPTGPPQPSMPSPSTTPTLMVPPAGFVPSFPTGSAPGLPPLPPLPARPSRSFDAPPAFEAPAAFTPPAAPAKPTAPVSGTDDPLLRLLRNDPAPEPTDDDDLLPAFLRERNDDDSLLELSPYIPDLPDSVDSGLKILPFGSKPAKKPESEDEEPDNFIPQMPD